VHTLQIGCLSFFRLSNTLLNKYQPQYLILVIKVPINLQKPFCFFVSFSVSLFLVIIQCLCCCLLNSFLFLKHCNVSGDRPVSQRTGLRERVVKVVEPVITETWVPEEEIELWQLKEFGERFVYHNCLRRYY